MKYLFADLLPQGPLGVAVTYGGDHIPKSPFNVAVAPTLDLSKINVTGLGDSTHFAFMTSSISNVELQD